MDSRDGMTYTTVGLQNYFMSGGILLLELPVVAVLFIVSDMA